MTRKEKQPSLGSTGGVEWYIEQGRIPTFSEPTTIVDGNGLSKKVVPCAIPGTEGQNPTVVFLSPGNATQIQMRVKHVLGNTDASVR